MQYPFVLESQAVLFWKNKKQYLYKDAPQIQVVYFLPG
jgi:hypothetical protein